MQRLTPTYRVTVAGKTPGGSFQDRLTEIKVMDKAGLKSDRVTLTFDNRGALLGLPPMGAEMQVWLGYKESGLIYMGRYVIDKISASGPPRILVLEGKAADMRSSLGAQKTRGWEGGSLGELVTKIAGRATWRARSWRRVSRPLIPGRRSSSTIHPAASSLSRSKSASPDSNVSTSNPSRSRAKARARRTPSSSSTT